MCKPTCRFMAMNCTGYKFPNLRRKVFVIIISIFQLTAQPRNFRNQQGHETNKNFVPTVSKCMGKCTNFELKVKRTINFVVYGIN